MTTNISIPVKKVTVLLRTHHPDKISIDIDMPKTYPQSEYEPYFSIDAAPGYGVQWVKDNLGVEPEIIDVRDTR